MSRQTLKQKLQSVVEEVSETGGSKYRCFVEIIGANKRCGYEQKTFVPANFKRHFIAVHPDVAKRLGFEDSVRVSNSTNGEEQPTPAKRAKCTKVVVDTNRKKVLHGTILLVTAYNLPLRFPEWNAVKLLHEPLWNAVNLKITRHTLPNIIRRAAEIMRGEMIALFRNKAVCLKVDSATRHGKSVFAINLTMADDDGNIHIHHLGKSSMIIL